MAGEAPAPDSPKPAPRGRGPAILEATFALAQLLVIVGGVLTFGLSLMAGVSWWMLLLRSMLAVAGLGAVAWALHWTVTQGVLEVRKRELEDREAARPGIELEA
jgi:hypothetical protein